jgi:hypothetical protein
MPQCFCKLVEGSAGQQDKASADQSQSFSVTLPSLWHKGSSPILWVCRGVGRCGLWEAPGLPPFWEAGKTLGRGRTWGQWWRDICLCGGNW